MSRKKNLLYFDPESHSDPLGGVETWPLPAGLVPTDRRVVLKTKNAG